MRSAQRGGAPIALSHVGAVGHQTAVHDLGNEGMDGGKMVGNLQLCDFFAIPERQIAAHEDHGLRTLPPGIAKGGWEVLYGLPKFARYNLDSDRQGRLMDVLKKCG